MQCAACGRDNRADRRFCAECGTALLLRCTACGAANEPGEKFCGGCGASLASRPAAQPRPEPHAVPAHLADKILTSRPALEGERKQVTVLFADVQGSMELAEGMDPEVWSAIMQRFFRILSGGVERLEGFVDKFTGDGIMALFGAPIAHEDHAQRACYAALQLRDEIARYATQVKREQGVGFSMRMGLHSGEVVVGKIGDDLRMDYTAQGHTVGLAQRMETLASPDTCYLTGATAALVAGYFTLEDLGDFQIKGVSVPVRVHRLVGAGAAHTRFDISRARGLTRFVGRDADMATLEAALEHAQAGNGQVVGVVAEAGTGKSRLCFEFVERCRARDIVVLEGHAVAHGKSIPLLPMLEIFRAYYGITERDDDRTVREKIAGRMLLLDEAFRDVLPLLFEFVGRPDPDRPAPRIDPDAKQRQLFAVLRRIVQGVDPRAGARNFVTLIEDLHWLDPGSEAFLEQWVEAIAGSSGFLFVNFRPEYRAPWMQKSYYRQLPLAPLGPAAIRELLDDLLGADPSIQGLAEAIHGRTGGNPFFTEEVIQTLIESGHLEGTRGRYRLVMPIARLEVPASVQVLLASRIDRLPERDKRVLQAAAVIGTQFTEPILLAAAEIPETELRATLTTLKTHEFVYEQALYPVAEYAFKHPLTQEVALGSQLQERRGRTHASVARAIEAAHAGKLEEHAALLAHHWEEAGEALTAAGWHQRAAQRVRRNDSVQAVRHMHRVLALTDGLAVSDERSELRLDACTGLLIQGGWRVGLSPQEVETLFAEGRELAARVSNVERAFALYMGYSAMLGVSGDPRRYHDMACEAAGMVDGTPRAELGAVALIGVSYSSFCLGRLQEALDAAERITALVEGDPSVGVEITGFSAWGWSVSTRAGMVALLGRLDEARAMNREAIQLARTHDLGEVLGWSLGGTVDIADMSGHTGSSPPAEEARRHALETVQLAERIGSPFSRIGAYRWLGGAHMLHGNWSDAAEALDAAMELMRQHRTGLEREAQLLADLSRAHLGMNDAVRARALAEESVARAMAQGARYFACLGLLALAQALRADAGVAVGDELERCLGRALELVRETGARTLEPQVVEERARLAALRGDRAAASNELQRACALYVEVGADGHAERLARERATTKRPSSSSPAR